MLQFFESQYVKSGLNASECIAMTRKAQKKVKKINAGFAQ
jgi:hypothetical protein